MIDHAHRESDGDKESLESDRNEAHGERTIGAPG